MSRRGRSASRGRGSSGDSGNASGVGAGGEGADGGGVSNSFSRIVLGDGIAPPEYCGTFSRVESARFVRAYEDYKGNVELSNDGPSVQRSLLTVSQLLRRNIRSSLMRRVFPTERGEPSAARLLEALARHGECWDGGSMDPSDATAAVGKIVRIGSEPTAMDRVDAVIGRLESYFENRSAESFFRNNNGTYKRGPARVITQSLVNGLKPAGFKDKVVRELDILEGWKSDPEVVFDVLLAAAEAWRTVEHDAKFNNRQAARGKPGAGAKADDSQSSRSRWQYLTCWTCGGSGHRSTECTSAGKEGSGDTSAQSRGSGGGAGKPAPRPQGQQHRGRAAPQAKGTPAARGGAQSKPAGAHGAAVGGRAAVPAGDSTPGDGTPGGGTDSGVVPPNPLPNGGAPGGADKAASWRAVAPGGASRFISKEVDVRTPTRMRLVDLSIPGAANPQVYPVKAVLDFGSGISTITPSIAANLQDLFPGVTVVGSMDKPQPLRVVDGRDVMVTQKAIPLRVAFHTSWGPVLLEPQPLAVMPGTDDVMIIGTPMMERLGIDVEVMAKESARAGHEARVSGVDSPNVASARQVTLSVDALQPADREEVPDEAVARLVARGPDMVVSPEEKERGRQDSLDAAVESAATAGLSDQGVSKLRGIVGRRWNAFRRALRGDPPADVEPMRVERKPGTHSVKARPRTYNPAKTAWLTTCLATLVATGMLFLNKQAVWSSAVMATPKKQGYRMVGDFRQVNKVVEKSPGVMPNQEACMQRLSEATCYGSLDMLQGYWQMPVARDFHHRRSGGAVHAHPCAPRPFERDVLLPSYDDRAP